MNTVKTFMNENLGTVRVATNENGEWFVAKDVCDILEIHNPSDACNKRLDEDEKGIVLIYTPGGNQEMLCVNEYGLWQLVLGSRKPQAKDFKRWLTHEVIPAIRKNGGYIDGQEHVPIEEKIALEAEVRELHSLATRYKFQNDYLFEKVESLVRIIENDTTGDFSKKENDSWTEERLYDLDVEGYDKFQNDMEVFNFSDYSLMEELKAIVNSAHPRYIDKSAAKHLVRAINHLFIERNA